MASKDRSEKGAVSGQEDGQERGEGRENATKRKRKRSKNSAVLHTMWRLKAMPKKARAHCSIVRLAERREGLGVQSLAEPPNLLLTGCRAFVLDGTKRFHDKSQDRTVLWDAMRFRTPELQWDGKKKHVFRQEEQAMVPRQIMIEMFASHEQVQQHTVGHHVEVVKKTTVGQGHAGVDEACLIVRASVKRTPADTQEHQ